MKEEEEEEYPSISKFNSRDYLNFESTIRSSLKLNSNSPHVVGFYFVVVFFLLTIPCFGLVWFGLDWFGFTIQYLQTKFKMNFHQIEKML